MLLAHALSIACHRERHAAAALRRATRRARRAGSPRTSPSRKRTRRWTASLYELVDRQTRERYEARLPLR